MITVIIRTGYGHFGTGAKVSVRRFGTGAKVSETFRPQSKYKALDPISDSYKKDGYRQQNVRQR